jgi:hypothetical protein
MKKGRTAEPSSKKSRRSSSHHLEKDGGGADSGDRSCGGDVVLLGLDDDDFYADGEENYGEYFGSGWCCPGCRSSFGRRRGLRVEKILTWRWREDYEPKDLDKTAPAFKAMDGVEGGIGGAGGGVDVDAGASDEFFLHRRNSVYIEYLAKFQTRSYRHVEWVSGPWVASRFPKAVNKFWDALIKEVALDDTMNESVAMDVDTGLPSSSSLSSSVSVAAASVPSANDSHNQSFSTSEAKTPQFTKSTDSASPFMKGTTNFPTIPVTLLKKEAKELTDVINPDWIKMEAFLDARFGRDSQNAKHEEDSSKPVLGPTDAAIHWEAFQDLPVTPPEEGDEETKKMKEKEKKEMFPEFVLVRWKGLGKLSEATWEPFWEGDNVMETMWREFNAQPGIDVGLVEESKQIVY